MKKMLSTALLMAGVMGYGTVHAGVFDSIKNATQSIVPSDRAVKRLTPSCENFADTQIDEGAKKGLDLDKDTIMKKCKVALKNVFAGKGNPTDFKFPNSITSQMIDIANSVGGFSSSDLNKINKVVQEQQKLRKESRLKAGINENDSHEVDPNIKGYMKDGKPCCKCAGDEGFDAAAGQAAAERQKSMRKAASTKAVTNAAAGSQEEAARAAKAAAEAAEAAQKAAAAAQAAAAASTPTQFMGTDGQMHNIGDEYSNGEGFYVRMTGNGTEETL